MRAAKPTPSLDRNATALDDYRTWEEIKRIARQAANGRPYVREAYDGLRAKHVDIDGAGYYIRSEVQGKSSDRPVIVVAIEHRPRDIPPELQLRRTYGLTPHETRVALLLAARLSNREIAEALAVSEHTARRHTEKVLLKLGIHRRAAVRTALIRCRNPADDAVGGLRRQCSNATRRCHK